jgi:protein MpaA
VRHRAAGVLGAALALAGPPMPAAAERIGRSVEGRPIGLTRVGDPAATRRVLVVGCVHGHECAGRGVVDALREATPPARTQLLLVRNANPDGFARRTRGNAHGVDLNRNAAQGWRARGLRGTLQDPGARPFSEPETRALRALILRERPALTVWYHQALALVDPPEAGRARPARDYARRTGLPLRRLPAYPGSLSRWQNARVRAGSSFVVELPRGRLRPVGVLVHAAAVLSAALGAEARRGRARRRPASGSPSRDPSPRRSPDG